MVLLRITEIQNLNYCVLYEWHHFSVGMYVYYNVACVILRSFSFSWLRVEIKIWYRPRTSVSTSSRHLWRQPCKTLSSSVVILLGWGSKEDGNLCGSSGKLEHGWACRAVRCDGDGTNWSWLELEDGITKEAGIKALLNSTWTDESLNFLASGTEEDVEDGLVWVCLSCPDPVKDRAEKPTETDEFADTGLVADVAAGASCGCVCAVSSVVGILSYSTVWFNEASWVTLFDRKITYLSTKKIT